MSLVQSVNEFLDIDLFLSKQQRTADLKIFQRQWNEIR